NNRGHVGVEDGPESPVKAAFGGAAQGPSGAELVLNPLENNNIGVHGHADGENQAGDAGQRQGGGQKRQHAQDQAGIGNQGHPGDKAGEAVVDQQEQADGRQPDRRSQLADFFGALPQGGADEARFQFAKLHRQGAA